MNFDVWVPTRSKFHIKPLSQLSSTVKDCWTTIVAALGEGYEHIVVRKVTLTCLPFAAWKVQKSPMVVTFLGQNQYPSRNSVIQVICSILLIIDNVCNANYKVVYEFTYKPISEWRFFSWSHPFKFPPNPFTLLSGSACNLIALKSLSTMVKLHTTLLALTLASTGSALASSNEHQR